MHNHLNLFFFTLNSILRQQSKKKKKSIEAYISNNEQIIYRKQLKIINNRKLIFEH